MTDVLVGLNPAAIQRQIQALTAELLTRTIARAAAPGRPRMNPATWRASARESTTPTTRASC